jgi:hypothetical protein
MTEDEWLSSTDLEAMVKWLRPLRQRITHRKVRLFACAACRRAGHLLADKRLGVALEIAEVFAEGSLGTDALKAGHRGAKAAWKEISALKASAEIVRRQARQFGDDEQRPTADARYSELQTALIAAAAVTDAAAARLSLEDAERAAWRAGFAAARAVRQASRPGGLDERGHGDADPTAWAAEKRFQADLLRDLLGLQFARVPARAAWLKAKGTAAQLARGIYEERAFDRLPILGDALEDAGCTATAILDHCRGPGPHSRGCWVVDLLLGKG